MTIWHVQKLYRDVKYDKYIEDMINCDMEPEGISICPYTYCPRHMR